MKSQRHAVDLRSTKEERLILVDQAPKEDVEQGGGRYDCRGGAITVWSHPWTHAATRYDSATIGAFYVNGLAERIDRMETNEGFDLADLLHALAVLARKAFGDTKHGVQRLYLPRLLPQPIPPSSCYGAHMERTTVVCYATPPPVKLVVPPDTRMGHPVV